MLLSSTRQGTTEKNIIDMITAFIEEFTGTYPTRHKTKTAETRTDTKSTLATELHCDETERLIARRNECEVGTAEQVRRERSEFRLREDTIGIHLHETSKLLRCEASVKIDDGPDTD